MTTKAKQLDETFGEIVATFLTPIGKKVRVRKKNGRYVCNASNFRSHRNCYYCKAARAKERG